MLHQTSFSCRGNLLNVIFKLVFLWCLFLTPEAVFSQNAANDSQSTKSDQKLLDQFIQSKGSGIITFDASNIKQFWIDNSVIARKDYFEVFLKEGASVPLKLQLANVSGAQNCKIEVISETPDIEFTVSNMDSQKISSSSQDNNFLNFSVNSSAFSLEDTLIDYYPEKYFCFNLAFNSASSDLIKIKAIVLSFSDSENVISNANGSFSFSFDDIDLKKAKGEKGDQDESFYVTGKNSQIITKKSFLVADKVFSVSVKVKNTGTSATTVRTGYIAYSDKHIIIDTGSYPYQNINNVLNVVSSEKGKTSIIVDSYPQWTKGCSVSLNAKEDMSDIPSVSLLDGMVNISEVKELEDGKAEIVLNKPLNNVLKNGDKIRINRPYGRYLYAGNITLQPGEEKVFSHTVKRDDNFNQYSPQSFSRGVYYFRPLILSYSTDSKEENTIQVSEYSVRF